MGCKFAKENIKPEDDYSLKLKGTAQDTDTDYNQNNSTSELETSQRTAKYQTKVDRRVTSKYDIKALIGKGTFSEVLRVESKISKKPFAIKLVKIETDIEKQLFTSELAALAKISHHFVVKLEEVIPSKGVLYLVMQLATGGELYDRIKSKGHLDERYSCNITQMLLEAILYLHLNGIIHRDLKPENILFYHPGRDSKILITDFGFAKVQSGNNENFSTTWCGTPEYVGPELVKRLPYSYKVDMWALGVIVYVMLSGHLPFSAPTTAKLFNLIVNGMYSFGKPVWLNVSDSAKQFINKLLVVDPLMRSDASDAIRHSWLKSYPLLHKAKDSSILSKFNGSQKRTKVVNSDRIHDIPYVIDIYGYKNNPIDNNKLNSTKDNVALNSSKFSPDASSSAKLQDSLPRGLILPVTGEFQGNIISKEKILEDNSSTMSPSNVDSILTVNNTNSSPTNMTNIFRLEENNIHISDGDSKHVIQFDKGQPPALSKDTLSSAKDVYFPLKLNEKNKRSAYEGFEIIDEISEAEPSYTILSKPFRLESANGVSSPQITFEPRSRYIEKVGVWLNNADSGVEETCFIDESLKSPNSVESCVTLEKTISTDTNYHSAHSSFDRFLLPTVQKNKQDVNVPLKIFKSADASPNTLYDSDVPYLKNLLSLK